MKLHLKDGNVLKYKSGMSLTGIIITSIELEFEDDSCIPEEVLWHWNGKATINKSYSLEDKLKTIQALSEAIQRNEPMIYEHTRLAEKKLLDLIASL
ncbi:hypothetical protein [Acinetobacter schindleri]|jgi:hypothetical protein|uniref:hypothetical protein n=1 Tax=Acinetobacter schindleri TaxID=108981 RepID=UPI002896E314|nr:hypothetical protein [Acinetobacter schindleri]